MLPLTIGFLCFALAGATSGIIRIPLTRVKSSREAVLRQISKFSQDISNGGKLNPETLYYDGIYEYYGKVSFGTPPQDFLMVFDVSSSNILVPSSDCGKICGHHHMYDHSKSKSYVANGTKVHFRSTFGRISGFLSTDTLEVAGLSVKNQTFTEVSSLPHLLLVSSFDGIFGLGLKPTGIHGTKSPLENMKEQGLLSQNVFTTYFTRGSHGYGGEITFGGIDSTRYTGKLNTVEVLSPNRWEFILEGIQVNDKFICDDGNARLITTVPFIFGPKDQVQKLLREIGARTYGMGFFHVPCSSRSSLPPIDIAINGVHYYITGPEYTQAPTYPEQINCHVYVTRVSTHDTNMTRPTWIFGTIFLSKVYTIFEMQSREISFGKLVSS